MFLNEQKIKGKIKFMNNLRKKKEINKNNIVHAIKILFEKKVEYYNLIQVIKI